jgi:hypothetical protein
MPLKKILFAMVAAVAVLLCVRCASDISGGGSEAGNARIVGMVLDKQGTPAGDVILRIMPSDFNPVRDAPVAGSCLDTTTTDGMYRFNVTKGQTYTIQALHKFSRLRGLVALAKVSGTDDTIAGCVLKPAGAIRVMLPSGIDSEFGYLYVPGTTFHAFLSATSGYALLDSLPAGVVPSISYSSTKTATSIVVRQKVDVLPETTITIAYPDWPHSKRLVLNTSISGADVRGTVYGFPALIRLTANVFDFSQAKTGGEDIRFASSGGAPLPFEIERWDAAAKRAEVWVKIDTIFGNDSDQSITMYWGASTMGLTAASPSSGAAVFDTALGFQGVWHLGDDAQDSIRDATANRYHGVSPDSARPPIAEGIIGDCREFDGNGDYITMPNTATGRIDFPQNGRYSVSAWVMADTFIDLQQTLVSKDKYQYFLWLSSTAWQFCEYQDRSGWDISAQQATLRQWVLLTGVRDGATHQLYVNGELTDSVTLKAFADPRSAAGDLILGRAHELGTFPNPQAGFCSYKGRIDEVRVCSTVPGTGWIKLCYMNQRSDDKLVTFR